MKKYFQVFKIAFMTVFEYRGEIISSFLIYLLGILFSFFLWLKLISDYTTIGPYDLNSIMTYYLLSGILLGFFNKRITQHFERWVNEGKLAQLLVKPVNVSIFLFFREFGQRIGIFLLSTTLFTIPIITIPGIRSTINLTLPTLLWLFIFSLLSNLFLYIFYLVLGNLAFWLINLDGVRNVTVNLLNILKGLWFPLDLAPQAFQNILSLLPFQYAMFYPIKILTSERSQVENIKGLLVLSVSIILMFILSRVLWKKGLKRFDSVGM